jgi:hypothetical protein
MIKAYKPPKKIYLNFEMLKINLCKILKKKKKKKDLKKTLFFLRDLTREMIGSNAKKVV